MIALVSLARASGYHAYQRSAFLNPPSLARLLFALTGKCKTVGEAWRLLKDSRGDCIPVVTTAAPHQYVGVVRRRDLLRLVSDDVSSEWTDE
jgi:hypothetical protein